MVADIFVDFEPPSKKILATHARDRNSFELKKFLLILRYTEIL